MKKIIPMSLVVITTVTLSILGFLLGGVNLSDKQKDILLVLLIINKDL